MPPMPRALARVRVLPEDAGEELRWRPALAWRSACPPRCRPGPHLNPDQERRPSEANGVCLPICRCAVGRSVLAFLRALGTSHRARSRYSFMRRGDSDLSARRY